MASRFGPPGSAGMVVVVVVVVDDVLTGAGTALWGIVVEGDDPLPPEPDTGATVVVVVGTTETVIDCDAAAAA